MLIDYLDGEKNEMIFKHFFPNFDIKIISNFQEMCKTKFYIHKKTLF